MVQIIFRLKYFMEGELIFSIWAVNQEVKTLGKTQM